jgi:hypothetical protein
VLNKKLTEAGWQRNAVGRVMVRPKLECVAEVAEFNGLSMLASDISQRHDTVTELLLLPSADPSVRCSSIRGWANIAEKTGQYCDHGCIPF